MYESYGSGSVKFVNKVNSRVLGSIPIIIDGVHEYMIKS